MSLVPFQSQLIADVGISFGDEGKGRLIPEVVSELANTPRAVSVVLKVNGGANSGHTAGGLKLNLLPAGVVEPSVGHLFIGAGVVADPCKILWEARPLEERGYRVFPRLVVDQRAMVCDLTHRLLDLAWEDYRKNVLQEKPRGSTGRGVTPSYQDENGQMQITFGDLIGGADYFARKFAERADRAVRTIKHVCRVSAQTWDEHFEQLTNAEVNANSAAISDGIFQVDSFDFVRFRGPDPFTLDVPKLVATYWEAGQQLRRNIGEVRELILGELLKGRSIIGEFGQAYWLDKRHGFSPNVTASHTFTPEFFESAGIPVQPIHTFAVAKAYDTKVGTHTFVTEMDDSLPIAHKLKLIEFGTVTRRQRMVGWYDAVEKGDALRYGGFQDLMINKIDALTGVPELLICKAYKDSNGLRHVHVPRAEAIRRDLMPVYEKYPGWVEDISAVRQFSDLPRNAQLYTAAMLRSVIRVAFPDKLPATLPNLRYLGVGPSPSQIIKDIPTTTELLRLT